MFNPRKIFVVIWFLVATNWLLKVISLVAPVIEKIGRYAGIPDDVLIFDGGHNIIKACTLKRGSDREFPHALKRIALSQYLDAVNNLGKELPPDYIALNRGNDKDGNPMYEYYVVGESATGYDDLQRVTGPNRYTRDYYGIFLAVMLYRMFKTGRDVAVYASYPTGDHEHRKMLAKAIVGTWDITVGGVPDRSGKTMKGGTRKLFNVTYVNTYEEARGGANNLILAESGLEYADKDINDGDALVIDIGGGTVDIRSIKNGKITPIVGRSIDLGIQSVETAVESMLLSNHPQEFIGVRQLPLDQLRTAIRKKVWDGGGNPIDITFYIQQAMSLLVNQIGQIYNAPITRKGAGGPMLWRYIIMTGGGGASIYEYLLPVLRHTRVVTAEDDPNLLHLANIHGGRKMWKFAYSKGLL